VSRFLTGTDADVGFVQAVVNDLRRPG
jgi:hypothetical protein